MPSGRGTRCRGSISAPPGTYQFQSIAAIGPNLIETFIIDFTWFGTLIGLYMLPGTVIAIPSGIVGQRFGAKSIVLLGLALMVIGGLMTGIGTFQLAFAGRLISGVGAVMLTKMVADWFAEREIVVAMSLVIATWPLGTALGLVQASAAAGHHDHLVLEAHGPAPVSRAC